LVAATPEFGDRAAVLDASSALFLEVLGNAALHGRSVAGVASLFSSQPVPPQLVRQ